MPSQIIQLMKFDRFSHAGENDRDSSMFISLLKGGFRSVTGLIGRLNREYLRAAITQDA